MEAVSLFRSFTVVSPMPRVMSVASAEAVATILPMGSQSIAPVAAADSSAVIRDERNPTPQVDGPGTVHPEDRVTAKITKDIATNSMVFMELDSSSQLVILQIPDEHLLKLRAYVAEMTRREEDSRQMKLGGKLEKTS